MTDIILGVDLGTTFSVMAYVDDKGYPRLIDNAEGKILTPSVLSPLRVRFFMRC
jgi:molecular chaperone DnaK (HSP70)